MSDTETTPPNQETPKASNPAPCSAFPEYCGTYFAIFNGMPVILTIEETHMMVAYDTGDTDPVFGFESEGLESWIEVEKAFEQNAEAQTPE